jgi:hypothetical protein
MSDFGTGSDSHIKNLFTKARSKPGFERVALDFYSIQPFFPRIGWQ